MICHGRALPGFRIVWRDVDLDAHAHDLFTRLRKEGALLPLEEAARRARSHLGEARWGCGGEEGHELVARGGCGVLARDGVGVLGEVDVWGRSVVVSGDDKGVTSERAGGEGASVGDVCGTARGGGGGGGGRGRVEVSDGTEMERHEGGMDLRGDYMIDRISF